MLNELQLRRIAGGLGLAVAAVGVVAAAGWLAGADLLRPFRPSAPPMKFNAALCLALAGASLWLQRDAAPSRAGRILAGLVLAIAAATVLEHLTGLNLFLDQWIVADRASLGLNSPPGRMSLPVAVGLTTLAFALLALAETPRRSKWPLSTWLATLVAIGALAGLIVSLLVDLPEFPRGYFFGLHVGTCLFLLGVGILAARPRDRLAAALASASPAGRFTRRMALGVALGPVLVALAFVGSLRAGWITLPDATLMFALSLVVLGSIVALAAIRFAIGIYDSRDEAEQARQLLTARLQEQAAQLQETVHQRTSELRQANANLLLAAESNALLALVAQHSTNGVVICDPDGRVEWCNAAYTRLTGYELAELKGRRPGHVLQGPESDAVAVARLREAESRGNPCRVELLNYHKSGAAFWQVIDLQPVRDRAGQLVNFISNHSDITRERADQLRLQHLNERLELATRAAALGVWEWDAATQRSTWDDRTLALYGLSAAAFGGTIDEWIERVHPLDRAVAVGRVRAVIAGGSHYESEFRIVRADDGQERFIQSRGIAQRDSQGRLVRIVGTERDITPERESTQRVETLNERLRLALRSSRFGVWEYDILSGQRFWDDRVLEIFDYTRREFEQPGLQWIERVHPDDRAATEEHFRRVVSGEIAEYLAGFRVILRDGTTIRHVESHGYVQRDSRGKPIRLVGLSRDVTEQKQMAIALELAEQRWQLAIEGTNDSVWDWDIPSGRIFHDVRWSRMLGYAPGELDETDAGWRTLVHPDDLADNEAALQAHFRGDTPHYQHELRLRGRDNRWRWILDRGKVVRRDPDGRPLRMAGTHTDITERKLLERRLAKSEELAQEVSRLALIGGWEIDLAGSRVIWNEGTCRIHEVDESFQPSLDAWWQFFPPEPMAVIQDALARVSPAAPAFDVSVPLITARGRRIWVRILGHGEFRAGKAVSVLGAIQDITAQHENEEGRRELETQLFQAQKMETLGTLAGGIAHDFNNLLTGIIGYHELAADSVPEDHPARFCLNEARNASLRARELVEQILTFGRQSAATEHGPIDLSLVIEEARRFLRATLPANITIELHLARNLGTVLADATQIHQVILNLGSNAAHAMRHHGGTLRINLERAVFTPELVVTLGSSPAASYVRLSVSDTGHGMDETTRRRIFDPFFTTKNTREGTGLGLAVVHGIVRSHRGTIDVESIPGQGSTFHIYLPCAEDHDPADLVDTDVAPRGGGEYVCVVDDEEIVGSCTKLVLESKGYRTLTFASAEDCLAAVQQDLSRCAVLVTDQTMPGMQGTELAAALRKLNAALPVVIMSGDFSKSPPAALDELGSIELLAKPFTSDELAHAVYRALHPAARH